MSKKSEEKLSEIFEKDVRVFLVTTGTAANGLALSALLVSPAMAATGPSVDAGKPCNGCVGNADDKTPPGQMLVARIPSLRNS